MKRTLHNGTDPSSPKDEPCIWMDAGVISFKICDRDLDCEHCPLDRALRGEGAKEGAPDESALSPFLEPLARIPVDTGRYYHPGHTWIRVEGPDRVRLGLDPFLAGILGFMDAFATQKPGRAITRGAALGEIVQDDRCFPVLSPVSGTVRGVNPELARRPALVLADPLGDGWVLVAHPSDLETDLAACRTGKAVLSWTLRGMEWVNAYLSPASGGPPGLGPTLFDGGSLCRGLKDLLPPDRYRRLVLRLLGEDDDWNPEP